MSDSYFDRAAADWDDQPRRVQLVKATGAAILHEVQLSKTMGVLDYGCGTGLLGLYLLPHVRSVAGADSSLGMLDVLNKKITEGGLNDMRAIRLDLENDPVPEDRFDLIVVGMAMHHIANVDKVLMAFHTMLRPGGILCIADLDTEPGTFHPASNPVPHHGFDRGQLKTRLAGHGFVETTDVTAATFSKPVEAGGEQEFSIFLVTARRP